jgi:malonyl-CoA/methylmalonyl-CoA synthetase
MPGVVVRLLAESGEDVTTKVGKPGEIQVKGANVFTGSWNDAVDQDGQRWFKTGDIGLRDTDEDGGFRVLGRNSVDIIKVRSCLPSALDNPSS